MLALLWWTSLSVMVMVPPLMLMPAPPYCRAGRGGRWVAAAEAGGRRRGASAMGAGIRRRTPAVLWRTEVLVMVMVPRPSL
jgi:hypothetical protein